MCFIEYVFNERKGMLGWRRTAATLRAFLSKDFKKTDEEDGGEEEGE